jgi:hypothetical protein
MNTRRFHPALAVMLSGVLLVALMLLLASTSSSARSGASALVKAVAADVPSGDAPVAQLGFDLGANVPSSAPLPIALPNACVAPIVLSGSIITGVNPVMAGRLIRNGVPGVCGQDFACSGVQSTSTNFSYETFNFINPSADWQCVQVTLDTRDCSQQVYSAAYLNSFNPADQCANNQGAMGFSTAAVYGYSFMVPPSTDFVIANNTIGVVPPSANCASYVMTTTLCSTDYSLMATKQPAVNSIVANSLGEVVVPVDVVFQNTGNFAAAISAESVSETVSIQVQDGQPAAAQATFGHAGAIVQAGETTTQTIQLQFSGSQFQCLSRNYQVTSELQMTAGVYHCNGFNPPSSAVYVGSILPDDAFDEDSLAFQALPGTHITATVDTVSAATAFDIEACISGTPGGECLPGLAGDDDFACTFPPPSFSCPRFGGLLPADPDNDNVYYLRINSGSGASNFAGPTGEYRASTLVTAGPTGMCPLVPVLDNGANSFLSLAGVSTHPGMIDNGKAPTTTITANVVPIDIRVPPSNPFAPGCGSVFLPLIMK